MKCLKVHEDRCMGCGACVNIDEEHFDFDDETGVSVAISQENLDAESLLEAINACPVSAIEIVEENE